MKKLIHLSVVLLGVGAVVVAAPSARATEPVKPVTKTNIFDAKPSPGYRDRVVYVISNDVETGSNIPTVFRVYHGVVTSSSTVHPSTYYSLATTGSENLGGALAKLDPSISTH